jgi:hypothetical protein
MRAAAAARSLIQKSYMPFPKQRNFDGHLHAGNSNLPVLAKSRGIGPNETILSGGPGDGE